MEWATQGEYPVPAEALPPAARPFSMHEIQPGQVLTDRGSLMTADPAAAQPSRGRLGWADGRLSSAGQQSTRPSSSSTMDLRSQWTTLASPAKHYDLVVSSLQV
jgi:hypothetical protein